MPTPTDPASAGSYFSGIGLRPALLPRDRDKFNAELCSAVYGDQPRLLGLIVDPTWRRILCKPRPNSSYDLFQQSLQDDVNVLLDLEFDATKYSLTRRKLLRSYLVGRAWRSSLTISNSGRTSASGNGTWKGNRAMPPNPSIQSGRAGSVVPLGTSQRPAADFEL